MKNQTNNSALLMPARGLRIAALAAVLLLAAGCSSLPQSASTQLKDDSQLVADPKNENARSFRAAAPLERFGAIRVEPGRDRADRR